MPALTKSWILVYLLYLFIPLVSSKGIAGQPISFRKVNSGTRADIRALAADKANNLYFLTDGIHILHDDTWAKMDFPVEGKIFAFCPVSADDIWFSVTLVTSTSLLYHYYESKTENIRTPFSNFISNIFFVSENSALFASWADMAVYDNGSFSMLPPLPARFGVNKLASRDMTSFWALTGNGRLFFFNQGKYRNILNSKRIKDFCIDGNHDGFLVSSDELYRINETGAGLVMKSDELRRIRKLALQKNGALLMIGDGGLIMEYSAGKLRRLGSYCRENLTDLLVTPTGEIWICGDGGTLLYSGSKQFPAYSGKNQGFSTHKLIQYGIITDDEYGVALADFNGDERTDIYTVRIYEQNRLYINNQGQEFLMPYNSGFTEEAVKRGAIGVVNPDNSIGLNELKMGISAADIDNDNDQDIYLCYLNSNNKLLLNRGNGYFRNVSTREKRACEDMKRSNAAAFADVDNDGDLDLFVTSEEGSNRLFENDGTGHFEDITGTSGLATDGGGMCASFADVNNDGLPDLCVSFWYPSNKLYFNESSNGKIRFRDVTRLTDLARAAPSKSNAVAFSDVNNDGFTDLFIANRNTESRFYLNDGHGLFKDVTRDYFLPSDQMSNGAAFADFDLDGFTDLYVTNVGENVLYKNINGRYFKDITSDFGAEMSGYCTGCATGDVDNDGDPDLYVANYINGNSNLFLNNTEQKNFLKFRLRGVSSNRDAIGAKIWLFRVPPAGEVPVLSGYRELNGGSGYCSVSEKEMIFGVDPGKVYYALVKFPSSADTIRVSNLVAGKTILISESEGFQAFYTLSGKKVFRFFADRENQPEIVKYFAILLLLVAYNLKLRGSNRRIAFFRWLACGFIFLAFAGINQIFLFSGLSWSFFVAPLTAAGLLVILHLFTGRILLKRIARKEKLDLREKLSRDLHDDLASTLGSISIYADTLKAMDEPSQTDSQKLSVKIAGLTQSALQSISDIIWMTSPRNDSLQSLISKTSNYMLEILTDNNINFIATIEIPDNPVILKEKIRNDAFLILKEGLHNIIRHSGARNVEFVANLKDNGCFVRLKDDGVGIEDSKQIRKGSHGNGLVNMHRRAQESGMDFSINTGKCAGTEIVMHFKI